MDELLARVAAAATETRPVERAALLGARAEAGRAAGRPDAARVRARRRGVGRGRPPGAGRAACAGARRRSTPRPGTARRPPRRPRAAHAIAVRLGAGWLRGEIESLAARARLTLEPTARRAAEPPEEDAFGLTARERQVLALMAEGATNREIGATLFMAEKTASVHVSRILTKLNARSRTEAAAVAHRHGLAEPGDG